MSSLTARALLLCVLSAILGGCGGDAPSEPVDDSALSQARTYREKAKALYDHVARHYAIDGTKLYLENFPRIDGDRQAAYLWPFSGMFAAAGLVQSLGYDEQLFQRSLDAMEDYWDPRRLPVSYQSFPEVFGGGDRYYDDNAVVGLDVLRNFEITGRPLFYDRAEAALLFVMDGESPDCGGGVFWNEQYRADKVGHPWAIKTGSASALGVALALQVHRISGKPAYLQFARRVYAWYKATLQDPADGLYWDSIRLGDELIDETKWAYNAGAMLTSGVLLYGQTGEPAYLDDARALAKAAYGHFVRTTGDRNVFLVEHDPWFAVVLLRGYLDLYDIDRDPAYIDAFIAGTDLAWKSARNPQGFFYEDWSGQRRGRERWILTQAAMIEVYARLAKFTNN
jgi:uncharacterized protein YyaL (SSP411 family)